MSDQTVNEVIDELLALSENASSGRWQYERDADGQMMIFDDTPLNRHIAYLSPGGVSGREQEANAALIVGIKNWLDGLRRRKKDEQ